MLAFHPRQVQVKIQRSCLNPSTNLISSEVVYYHLLCIYLLNYVPCCRSWKTSYAALFTKCVWTLWFDTVCVDLFRGSAFKNGCAALLDQFYPTRKKNCYYKPWHLKIILLNALRFGPRGLIQQNTCSHSYLAIALLLPPKIKLLIHK